MADQTAAQKHYDMAVKESLAEKERLEAEKRNEEGLEKAALQLSLNDDTEQQRRPSSTSRSDSDTTKRPSSAKVLHF
jgi:hypothetical protein